MKIGDRAVVERDFGARDLDAYLRLGGAPTGRGCVPAPLLSGAISALLGTRLPGPGANYLKQSTRFEAEALLGEHLRFAVEVTRLRPDKALVDLAVACTGADGRRIAVGRALIFIGDRPQAADATTKCNEDACL